MKQAKSQIWNLALALLSVLGLAACSSGSDFDDPGSSPSTEREKVQVRVRIGVQEASVTSRVDENATPEEMMYHWFVVITDEEDKIVQVVRSNPYDGTKERDEFDVQLTNDTKYRFYSFANIEEEKILPNSEPGTKVDFSAKSLPISGNISELPDTGIPMSNLQTITINNGGTEDLYVVRMWAKMQLQFTNNTGSAVTISKVTLEDITTNQTTTANLRLMPNPTGGVDIKACEPNLVDNAATSDYTISPTGLTVAEGDTEKLTFYVNESATPSNAFGLFYLNVELTKGDGSNTEERYALISNDKDDKWSYIARNDYRVIPVNLQEYRLDIVPYDWPPIGVYPASVVAEDGRFTITFHAAGHFHLQPVVTTYADGAEVPFNSGTDPVPGQWQYKSWEPVGTIPTDFYESDDTASSDGCLNGGTPKWSATDGFIFGYLKDTGVQAEGEEAPKAYHDLVVTVAPTGQTAASRELTYHLCIIKDIAY